MKLAVVTCWPPSVATGSGTAVAQHGLTDALARVDAQATVMATSAFAGSWPDARIEGLRARLDPAAVGRQVRAIVDAAT